MQQAFLGVQSRYFLALIPDFADVFVGRDAFERLQSASDVVVCHVVAEVGAQLVVVIVLEALDGASRVVFPTSGLRRSICASLSQ